MYGIVITAICVVMTYCRIDFFSNILFKDTDYESSTNILHTDHGTHTDHSTHIDHGTHTEIGTHTEHGITILPSESDISVAGCSKVQPHVSRERLTLTHLACFPGSGSSWFRHLLQQATGIFDTRRWKGGDD